MRRKGVGCKKSYEPLYMYKQWLDRMQDFGRESWRGKRRCTEVSQPRKCFHLAKHCVSLSIQDILKPAMISLRDGVNQYNMQDVS